MRFLTWLAISVVVFAASLITIAAQADAPKVGGDVHFDVGGRPGPRVSPAQAIASRAQHHGVLHGRIGQPGTAYELSHIVVTDYPFTVLSEHGATKGHHATMTLRAYGGNTGTRIITSNAPQVHAGDEVYILLASGQDPGILALDPANVVLVKSRGRVQGALLEGKVDVAEQDFLGWINAASASSTSSNSTTDTTTPAMARATTTTPSTSSAATGAPSTSSSTATRTSSSTAVSTPSSSSATTASTPSSSATTTSTTSQTTTGH